MNYMNNLNQAYNEVSTIGQYSKKYFSYLAKVLESINENEINKLGDLFESAREGGNTIFVAGNGGSSTTATTMANDIGFDILKKTGIDRAFRVLSLIDNNAVVTAIANDVGYENIFINRTEAPLLNSIYNVLRLDIINVKLFVLAKLHKSKRKSEYRFVKIIS